MSRTRSPARSTTRCCRPRDRRSSRSRWTTGAPRPTTELVRQVTARRVSGRAAPDATALRALAERLGSARNPVFIAGPDIDACRRLGARGRARRDVSGCRCGPPRRPAGTGSASPRTTRSSSACCLRRSERSPRRSRTTTWCLSPGRRCSPTTPTFPAPCWPRDSELVAITSDPSEAARAPMGDAILGDVALDARCARRARGRLRPRAARPPARSRASRPRRIRSRAARRWPRWPTCGPRTGSRCSRSPSSTMALRNRLRLGQVRELLLRRQRWARVRDLGGGGRAAGPPRPAGGVRSRRGVGAVRDHRTVERGRLQAAGHVPRAAQRGVHDPQVVRDVRAGGGGARASTCPASTSPPSPAATGCRRGT